MFVVVCVRELLCVCMFVYASVYVCVYAWANACMHVFMYLCVYILFHLRAFVDLFISIFLLLFTVQFCFRLLFASFCCSLVMAFVSAISRLFSGTRACSCYYNITLHYKIPGKFSPACTTTDIGVTALSFVTRWVWARVKRTVWQCETGSLCRLFASF